MKNTNLEALNALIEKIRAGEGTAESNLEALNMLCVLSGGTGKAKSNLEALNELLTVFEAAKPEQVKFVAITENGTTTVTPDDGHVLSSVNVDVNVPSKPEQAKSVTITENGTTEITPDEGYTLSGASVSVNVSSGSDYNMKMSIARATTTYDDACVVRYVEEIDFSNITWSRPNGILRCFFKQMSGLKKIIWGDYLKQNTAEELNCYQMFYYCRLLTSVDLSSLGAVKLNNVSSMFYDCSKLVDVVFGPVKINAPSLLSLFEGCTALETIDDTSFLDHTYEGVTSVERMFYNCDLLKSIDLSGLYTANITKTTSLFANCASLTDVKFENGCFSNISMTALYLNACPLTHDCAVDIFNKLATRTNSPTIQLSTTTKGYLTEEEYAIATGKGWVIG